MSKIEMLETFSDATGTPEKSRAFIKAWEKEEQERKAELEKEEQKRRAEFEKREQERRAEFEKREQERRAEFEKIIARFEENNRQAIGMLEKSTENAIARIEKNNALFISAVQRELQLQNKQLKFLSWVIPSATAFLGLTMIALSVAVVLFGGG